MSEYQYYEFQTLDQPLTQEEMAALRAISSRATITPSGFVNTYNWGDLSADPHDLLAKYFDVFVYVTNWNSRWLVFRMPDGLLEADAKPYRCGESCIVQARKGRSLVGLYAEDEGGDWEDGEGWLPGLASLRADLLAGDLRSLYLGWLLGVQQEHLDADTPSPPMPAGLDNLSSPLDSLVEFLRLDDDLLDAALELGAPVPAVPSPDHDLDDWLRSMKPDEKDAWLQRVARGEGARVQWDLLRQFRASRPRRRPTAGRQAAEPTPTVGAIRERRDQIVEQRRRKAAKQQAEEQARLDQRLADQRKRHLANLAKRWDEALAETDELIGLRQQDAYDRAVQRLVDLREVAEQTDRTDAFEAHVREIRRQHGRKTTLIQRLDSANL